VSAIEEWLQILIGSRPGELHHRGAQFECCCEAIFAGVEQQEIEPERLVGFPANGAGPRADFVGG